MSTSTLYLVYKTRAREVASFCNACGTSTPLWSYLSEVYLGRGRRAWLFAEELGWLWDAACDPKVPEPLRIAHAFTFDCALCRPEHRDRLAAACLAVYPLLAAHSPGTVNHWRDIGAAISALRVPARCMGIGLGGTSVNDPWESYPANCPKPFDLFAWIDGVTE